MTMFMNKLGLGKSICNHVEVKIKIGKTTGMFLEYNKVSEKGKLQIYSAESDKQMEVYRKKKAKEGAEGGF